MSGECLRVVPGSTSVILHGEATFDELSTGRKHGSRSRCRDRHSLSVANAGKIAPPSSSMGVSREARFGPLIAPRSGAVPPTCTLLTAGRGSWVAGGINFGRAHSQWSRRFQL
ncbi:hypothetical protein N7G274_006809 [Stereocaulon virgatum]|uniref:Uncharacterized protein n=1 Tax=Stereocaulon virgatum TaxID=373712 RepID=A0ABR4A611_9LECA